VDRGGKLSSSIGFFFIRPSATTRKLGTCSPQGPQFSRCCSILSAPRHLQWKALEVRLYLQHLQADDGQVLSTRKPTTTTRSSSHIVTSAPVVVSSSRQYIPSTCLVLPRAPQLLAPADKVRVTTTTAFWPRSICGRPAFRQSRHLHLQRRSRYVCVADAHSHLDVRCLILFLCLLPASVPATLFSHLSPFHPQPDVHLRPGLASPSVVRGGAEAPFADGSCSTKHWLARCPCLDRSRLDTSCSWPWPPSC
jgi:hypothetical protein